MAIIKHIPIKGKDYSAGLDYLLFQHNEVTGDPVLDENGNRILRDEYYLDGINVNPMMYPQECQTLNRHYHKNQKSGDIKAHHYIISFDPKDSFSCGLTGERAQQLGIAFATKYFPGFQTIVCTHTDGHNQSGNIHVHIMFNSVRKLDVAPRPFHERPCDCRAGYKHHETKAYMALLKQGVMDMCRAEHLHQVELLVPAAAKITDKEYWAARRGQEKLDEANRKVEEAGLTPRATVFQTQKQFLRDAIDAVAAAAESCDDFCSQLFDQYRITVTETRGRFSYLHPDREKNISDRALGAHYKKDYLEAIFQKNRETPARAAEFPSSFANERPGHDFHTQELHDFDPAYDYISNPTAVLFIRTKLRLVIDLQECIKARQNTSYAQRVKISNLQEMAKTVVFLQANQIGSIQQLNTQIENNAKKIASLKQEFSKTRAELSVTNRQIRYLGQYLSNKTVYAQMCKAPDRKQFRQEHASQIHAYEQSRSKLKEMAGPNPLPSMKTLSEDKAGYQKRLHEIQEELRELKIVSEQLKIAASNIHAILGRTKERPLAKEALMEY